MESSSFDRVLSRETPARFKIYKITEGADRPPSLNRQPRDLQFGSPHSKGFKSANRCLPQD